LTSDHDLTRVRKRYAEVAEILEMKYGEGKVDENIDPVWSGRNAIGGLNHGKNWLYRIFDADGIHIELSVFAESGATTNWRLIFEHVEGMKSLLAERRRREAATL